MSKVIRNKELVQNMLLIQAEPPVLVVPIARALGIMVYAVKHWENGLSGLIKKDKEKGGESGYAIYVNADHSETRRRFTIAHEISHYVFHESLIGDGIVDDALYRSGLSTLIETEANDFAAEILMPTHLIGQAIRHESSISKLAKMFNVSSEAIAIRLQVPEK